MNVYAQIKEEKIAFLALEKELDAQEMQNGWKKLGKAQETEFAAVLNGTWLGKPLFDENGIANYKLSDGTPTERSEEEKQAELTARPAPLPSKDERLDALEKAMLAMMMGGMPSV